MEKKYILKRVDEKTVEYYEGDILRYRHYYNPELHLEQWSEYDEHGYVIHSKSVDDHEWWSDNHPDNPKNKGVVPYIEPFTFKLNNK